MRVESASSAPEGKAFFMKTGREAHRAMRCFLLLILACALALAVPAAAQAPRAQYVYGAERACVSAGKFTQEQCANAAANAQAEFDEKAPRFPTREACEHAFGANKCSLGFSGADGWAGKKSGIHFSPRQDGFRIVAGAGRDMSVFPVVSGPAIGFSGRSIMRREAQINPALGRRARESWRAAPAQAAAGGAGQFGVDTPPPGTKAGLPPPPVDPHFDCAAVLEPSAKDSAGTGCYLAPARRR